MWIFSSVLSSFLSPFHKTNQQKTKTQVLMMSQWDLPQCLGVPQNVTSLDHSTWPLLLLMPKGHKKHLRIKISQPQICRRN